MATIYTPNGPEEWSDNDLRLHVYRALKIAAERIGFNGWKAECKRRKLNPTEAVQQTFFVWVKGYPHSDPRSMKMVVKPRSIYTPTEAHEEIIEAMSKVLSGELSPNDAMLLLHRGDILEMRTK